MIGPMQLRYFCPVLVLLVAMVVAPAAAQEPDSVFTDTAAAEVEKKSPTQALLYSLGGTAVPVLAALPIGSAGGSPLAVLLLGGGAVFGPSLGHVYAENYWQVLAGACLRLAIPPLTASGIYAITTSLPPGAHTGDAAAFLGAIPLFAGGLMFLSVTLWDISMAPVSAWIYNETHRLQARVAPAVGLQGEQVGLSLQVRF